MFLLLSLLLFSSNLISEADMGLMGVRWMRTDGCFQYLQIVAAPDLIIIKHKWKIFRDISPKKFALFRCAIKGQSNSSGGKILF